MVHQHYQCNGTDNWEDAEAEWARTSTPRIKPVNNSKDNVDDDRMPLRSRLVKRPVALKYTNSSRFQIHPEADQQKVPTGIWQFSAPDSNDVRNCPMHHTPPNDTTSCEGSGTKENPTSRQSPNVQLPKASNHVLQNKVMLESGDDLMLLCEEGSLPPPNKETFPAIVNKIGLQIGLSSNSPQYAVNHRRRRRRIKEKRPSDVVSPQIESADVKKIIESADLQPSSSWSEAEAEWAIAASVTTKNNDNLESQPASKDAEKLPHLVESKGCPQITDAERADVLSSINTLLKMQYNYQLEPSTCEKNKHSNLVGATRDDEFCRDIKGVESSSLPTMTEAPLPILRRTESYRSIGCSAQHSTVSVDEMDENDRMSWMRRKVKFQETSRGVLQNTIHEFQNDKNDDEESCATNQSESSINISESAYAILSENMEDALLDLLFLGSFARPRSDKKKKNIKRSNTNKDISACKENLMPSNRDSHQTVEDSNCSPSTCAYVDAQSSLISVANVFQNWIQNTTGFQTVEESSSIQFSSTTVEEMDDKSAFEDGLLDLVYCAARSKHLQNGVFFDESYEIDVKTEVQLVAVHAALPLLGVVLKQNTGGCYVTKIAKSIVDPDGSKVPVKLQLEAGDQLITINGKSAIKKSVSQVSGMLNSSSDPENIFITFVRYTGGIHSNSAIEEENKKKIVTDSAVPFPIAVKHRII